MDILADILSSSDRLPMILIHVRSPESWDAARLLSSRLIGLVRVITLNHATSRLLANVMPPIDVPFGGAHLVWSEVSAQGVTLRADELAALGGEGVRARFMPRLAALSALARGIDDGWRAARQAAQDEALAEVGEQILRAKEDRNVEAELAAFNSQTKQLRLQVGEWRDLAENEEIRANRFEALASEVDTARRESTYWRTQYQSLVDTAPASEIDPWSNIPRLIASTNPEATFRALEDAADEHIVFTDAASRSWKSIDYPDPEDMTLKLELLALAAAALYGDAPLVIGHLDDWLKLRGLNVAMTDDTIRKKKNIRYFDHDGTAYDQMPHVKVKDGVKPDHVGRIHFALDKDRRRLVVNHVALKLYEI
ncbi:MAG: hypothetical protein H7279_08725 [Microbacteriaceae bacterium]|nr:hypothetical protein [Microbacteriaceae bacterium]